MLLRFGTETWRRLAYERDYTAGLPTAVVTAFRERVQVLRAAPQEHVLHALDAWLLFRKSTATSKHYVMRITDDWEMVVAFEDGDGGRTAIIEAVVQLNKTITKERRL